MKIKFETVLNHLEIKEQDCVRMSSMLNDGECAIYKLPTGDIVITDNRKENECALVINEHDMSFIQIGHIVEGKEKRFDILLILDTNMSHYPCHVISSLSNDDFSRNYDFNEQFIEYASIFGDGLSQKETIIYDVLKYTLKGGE